MAWIEDLRPRRSRTTVRPWLIMILVVALLGTAHAAEAQSPIHGLFSPAEPSAPRAIATAPPDDITIRQREVTIDFDMLEVAKASVSEPTQSPAKLTLNLFDDVVLTAIVYRTAPTSSGYSLSGRIEGMELGTMTLVVNDSVVAGSVRTPVGTFRIMSVDKWLYAISEVDESKLPPVD